MNRFPLLCGAAGGLLAVAAGAFGAHGLRSQLDPAALAWWATGAEYHMYHSLALLALGLAPAAMPAQRWLNRAAWCFAVGIVFFSGSLYVLALTGIRGLGMITPLGGLLFLLGWGAVLVGALVREH